MTLFNPLAFNLGAAEAELQQFKVWLAGKGYVGETEIVAEIKPKEHMCGLLSAVCGFSAPDLIKPELTLKGLFRTDLVLGNNASRKFALVEFEDANEDSVFQKNKNKAQYRPWARRLEHGFGQVLDWAWLKSDQPHDAVLTNAFGGKIHASAFLVIAGRAGSVSGVLNERRFDHRANNVTIDGIPTRLLTYDQMVAEMENNLLTMKTWV